MTVNCKIIVWQNFEKIRSKTAKKVD